uniref:Uncharacterized protein n=1 Tax=Chromera velia CCMP2878 TaxID=1169474 RepID=A0A0G4GA19_9ALVE|eukprot:Cvel_20819.t1-p1 / transcript=Cvel_20819.t1 / gene=Cvel_20819 / organism=Chromera_velia_CCMP2878 / gene_product=hypothetical protein / transcript_product=hypothetical protein / location=Cvel_scaffold1903:25298-27904(-) / protein_length=472 / sequence_SO=supercontig / SO=protein_coding / is_pseudo=false
MEVSMVTHERPKSEEQDLDSENCELQKPETEQSNEHSGLPARLVEETGGDLQQIENDKGRAEEDIEAQQLSRELSEVTSEFPQTFCERGAAPFSLSSVSLEKKILSDDTDVVVLLSDTDVFANVPISAKDMIDKWERIREGSPVLVSTAFNCWLGRRCTGIDLSLYYTNAFGHPSTFLAEKPPGVHPIFLNNGLIMGRAHDLAQMCGVMNRQRAVERATRGKRKRKKKKKNAWGWWLQSEEKGKESDVVCDQDLLSEAVRQGLLPSWERAEEEGEGTAEVSEKRSPDRVVGMSQQIPFLQFDFFHELFGSLAVLEGNATANSAHRFLDKSVFFPFDKGSAAKALWRKNPRQEFGGFLMRPNLCWDATVQQFATHCERITVPEEEQLLADPQSKCALGWQPGWHRVTQNLFSSPVLFHSPGTKFEKDKIHRTLHMVDSCLGEGTLSLPNFNEGSPQAICHACPVGDKESAIPE